MVGHKDVGLFRIKRFQALDLDPEPGQSKVGLGPIGQAPMGAIAAGIEQTRQTASSAPKNHKQGKKENDKKLVGKKEQPAQQILGLHTRQLSS